MISRDDGLGERDGMEDARGGGGRERARLGLAMGRERGRADGEDGC